MTYAITLSYVFEKVTVLEEYQGTQLQPPGYTVRTNCYLLIQTYQL